MPDGFTRREWEVFLHTHTKSEIKRAEAFRAWLAKFYELGCAVTDFDHEYVAFREPVGSGCAFTGLVELDSTAYPERFTPSELVFIKLDFCLTINRSAVDAVKSTKAAATALRRIADRLEKAGRAARASGCREEVFA